MGPQSRLESLPTAPSIGTSISTGDGAGGTRPKSIILQGPVLSLMGQRSSFQFAPLSMALVFPALGSGEGLSPSWGDPRAFLPEVGKILLGHLSSDPSYLLGPAWSVREPGCGCSGDVVWAQCWRDLPLFSPF